MTGKRKTPAKIGRPSTMTPAMMRAICTRLGDGESLRKIAAQEGMPSVGTIMRWVASDERFREQYVRAREGYADAVADAMIDLADESDPANAGKVRAQLEARKWALSKMAPKKYGDRLDVTSAGEKLQAQIVVTVPDNARGDRDSD